MEENGQNGVVGPKIKNFRERKKLERENKTYLMLGIPQSLPSQLLVLIQHFSKTDLYLGKKNTSCQRGEREKKKHKEKKSFFFNINGTRYILQ